MPHSSGGGSSGGGFHSSGSSGGHSGSNISRTYYPGARRFARHYSDGRPDDYVYANSMPQRPKLSGVIIVIAVFIFFIAVGVGAVSNDMPKKLNAHYMDSPAVHDELGIIEDKDELVEVMEEYCDLTGVCPVIYTTTCEDWKNNYGSIESYTFDKYVEEFSDEQHFVIVYSVPTEQLEGIRSGKITTPYFDWHAVQGDETDEIISNDAFNTFGGCVQEDLEAGMGAGHAFKHAFEGQIRELKKMLTPGSPVRALSFLSSLAPIMIIIVVFIPAIILTVRQYILGKRTTYEEVPLDVETDSTGSYGFATTYAKNGTGQNTITPDTTSSGINMGAFATSSSRSSDGGYHASVNYDPQKGGSILTTIITFVFLIPFFTAGIGILIGGIAMLKAADDPMMGYFMIGFAVLWNIILIAVMIPMIRKILQLRKKEKEPLDVSYPTADYPQPVYPNDQTTSSQNNAEFDPRFFQSSKSNYEDDDEDYKRMKRQGYE